MNPVKHLILIALIFGLLFLVACENEDDESSDENDSADDDSVGDDDDNNDNDDDDDNDDNDNDDDDVTEQWHPSMVVPIENHSPIRGRNIIRGIIHLHSVYSHDACDNFPWINGHPNWVCFNQLRAAICDTNQQYIMLSDHKDLVAYHDFPEILLYTPEEGDELIYRDTEPIANVIHCEGGNEAIIMAGSENSLMPIAMERMPEGNGDDRYAFFARDDAQVVQLMKNDLDAIVFVPHAEGWETQEIEDIDVDGIEIYNLHANIDPGIREDYLGLPGLGFIFDVLAFLLPFSECGESDLIFLSFLAENTPDLLHWDILLDQRPYVGIMATDAHRNALPFPLLDGDRADSYRRMMKWFANYLLVDDVTVDQVKDAIAKGRLFGAFQVFGEPIGFDFVAQSAKGNYEMGQEVPLSENPEIHVALPSFWGIDDSFPAPEFYIKLIKAGPSGGTVVSETTDQELYFTPGQAGAYRAEVHVTPHHLKQWLGGDPDRFIRQYPLIYANAIYVVD